MLALILLCGCTLKNPSEDLSVSDGSIGFTVDYIDVVGGDAILIRTGGRTLLIDAGYEETSDRLLSYLKQQNVTALDYLLITHFDKDHIGGVPALCSELKIKNIIQPVYEKSPSDVYARYQAALSRSGAVVSDLTVASTLRLGGCDFQIYPAQGSNYSEKDNDYSLIVKTVYGDVSFLFAGDVEEDRLAEMLRQETDWSADVLKFPHHGSYNKRTESFLKIVSPSYTVITDSAEKSASAKTLSFLEGRDSAVFRTVNGTIVLETDGTEVHVRQ